MIEYVSGDACEPRGAGRFVIVHVCNDRGGWGAGFVRAVSRRWPEPEAVYRQLARQGLVLGTVQLVAVGDGLAVANVIAQNGYASAQRPVAVDYDALRRGLTQLADRLEPGTSVHMPRIGTGLGGGSWSEVAPIIEETLCDRGLVVNVYDLAVA